MGQRQRRAEGSVCVSIYGAEACLGSRHEHDLPSPASHCPPSDAQVASVRSMLGTSIGSTDDPGVRQGKAGGERMQGERGRRKCVDAEGDVGVGGQKQMRDSRGRCREAEASRGKVKGDRRM